MASTTTRELRWGIISTGWMASKFVSDLLVDPKTRGVHDVVHKVTVVGSRSAEKSQEFINTVVGGDKSIVACGSYEEVYKHEDVDVIYIGTPHTYHYSNSLDAIRAGKHVLCEKPVTCNAAELQALILEAKKHNVFFMEAMWTRFQPLVLEVKSILESGELGRPVVVHADFSLQFHINTLSKEHRMLNPMLAGGALLDLGPYPLVWAILSIYEHPDNDSRPPSSILASMIKTAEGVDQNTSIILTFSNPTSIPLFNAQAILTMSMNIEDAPSPGASIRCEYGTIEIDKRIPVPGGFTVKYHSKSPTDPKDKKDRSGELKPDLRREFKYDGIGWHFQADEVARCIWSGKLESSIWTHKKSLLEMQIFDEVRKQGGYVFPPGVEKVKD